MDDNILSAVLSQSAMNNINATSPLYSSSLIAMKEIGFENEIKTLICESDFKKNLMEKSENV